MTPSTSIHPASSALSASRPGPLPGLTSLTRKELTEWRRGRRAWVVLALTTLVMATIASVAWITDLIRRNVPPDVTPPAPASLVPLDNVLA